MLTGSCIEAVECGPLVTLLNFDLGGISYVDQIWNLARAKQELKPTLREIFAKFRYLQTLSVHLATQYKWPRQ